MGVKVKKTKCTKCLCAKERNGCTPKTCKCICFISHDGNVPAQVLQECQSMEKSQNAEDVISEADDDATGVINEEFINIEDDQNEDEDDEFEANCSSSDSDTDDEVEN